MATKPNTLAREIYCNNLVMKDGVIKELVQLEELARTNYDKKWGFMKDLDKICLKLASEKGITEAEYKRRTVKRKGEKLPAVSTWEPALSGPIPTTTTGEIGWRSSRSDCSLERVGPLYVSPRHTIYPPGEEPNAPITNIFLG